MINPIVYFLIQYSMEQHKPIERYELPTIKHLVIVASGKGGVGKSTVAAGLALSLAARNYKVGLMDADIHGPSIPTLFDLEQARPSTQEVEGKTLLIPLEKDGLKIMSLGFFFNPDQAVLWRGPMVTNALKQMLRDTEWGDLDYLVIDTPPGTGDVHITLVTQFSIEGVVIVTTPQQMAIADVQKAITMFKEPHINVPVVAIVENMAWFTPLVHPDERYYLFGMGGGQLLKQVNTIPTLIQIPTNELICKSCDAGSPQDMLRDQSVEKALSLLVESLEQALNSKNC
jgi:ATP-binding protein involved in chromosome partitioning